MKRILFLIVVVVSISLLSCGPSKADYDKLLIEKESLKYDIEALEKKNLSLVDSLRTVQEELNAYRYSPSKLCSNVSVLFKDEKLEALEKIEKQLEKYHPESPELTEVKSLCQKIRTIRQQRKDEEIKKRMQAVNRLKKTYDDVSDITWYENPYFTHYNNVNRTSLYIGKKDNSIWLRLKMSYDGEDWIFFKNAYLSYDGNTQEIFFDEYRDKKSDNSGGDVWEWINVSVDSSLLTFLRAMVDGKSVKMRLSGKYTKTRQLSTSEIKAIKDVLLAYDVLTKGE